MSPADFLARLQATHSEQERDWLLMEFNLSSLPPTVQAAVWAAAIPHWFDQPFLAALLAEEGVSLDETTWQTLLGLSYVEPFAGRGYNIHERTRSLLLDRLWQSDRERYRELSRRAAAWCAGQDQAETHWRSATLYHQLLGDAPGAVDKFASQGIDWHNQFAYDKVEALIRPVLEAVTAERLNGNAAAWAYFWQGRLDIGYSRNHAAKTNLETALTFVSNEGAVQANCIRSLGDVHLRLAEYAQARQRYEQALPLYQEIGDRVGQANCIRSLGDVHYSLAEYAQARQRYAQALPLYQEIGDRVGQANCIRSLGDVHYSLAEYAQARQRYEQALPLYQEIGERVGQANCIRSLGDVHYSLDEYAQARQRYEQALPLYQEIGERVGQANCIKGLGDVHLRLAEYAQARQRYAQALPLYQEIGDRVGQANCIQSLGDVHLRLAEYAQARQRYAQALPLYQEIGARVGQANCIRSLGDVHYSLAEYAQARQRYAQALPLYQEIGARVGQANCIQSLGDVHLRLAEYAQARQRYAQALPLYQEIGARVGQANCIQSLGDVHLRLAEYAQARQRYAQALPLYQEIGARVGQANCIQSLGDVHLRLAEYAQARQRYAQALPLYQEIGDRVGQANCIQSLGDLYGELDQVELAVETLQEAAQRYRSLQLNTEVATCLNSIGSVHSTHKQFDQALAAYSQAIAVAPNAMWQRNRADTYIELHQYDLAAQDLAVAEALQPNQPYAFLHRGRLALWQRQPQAAIQLFQSAIALRPALNDFHRWLAYAYLFNGQVEPALAALQHALDLTYKAKEIEEALTDLDNLAQVYGAVTGLETLRQRLQAALSTRTGSPTAQRVQADLDGLAGETTTDSGQ